MCVKIVLVISFGNIYYSVLDKFFIHNAERLWVSQEVKQLMFHIINFVESEKNGPVIPL